MPLAFATFGHSGHEVAVSLPYILLLLLGLPLLVCKDGLLGDIRGKLFKGLAGYIGFRVISE